MSINKEPELLKSPQGFWTNRKWFAFVSVFLICWISLYLFAHLDNVCSGYEYNRFSTQQIQQINRILYNNIPAAENKSEKADDGGVVVMQYDTLKNDSIVEVSRPVNEKAIATVAGVCDDSCHINKAMLYIRSEFDNRIKDDQLTVIRQYISAFGSQEVGVFLADLKIKVKSYFWLTGPAVYLEIVFWVIVGVACSILFAIGNASRNGASNKVAFNSNEIPYQVAKLFYAPFCTIILVLSYNYIKHRYVTEVNTNEGMIVVSFMAGLFSGRLMSLLERFKDVLLPEHTVTTAHMDYGNTETHFSGIGAIAAPAPKIEHEPFVEETHEPFEFAEEGEESEEAIESQPEDIKEVTIELKLDATGLFEEEREEIVAAGFSAAVVTLHNVNGKDILNLKYADQNSQNLFATANVKPGIYIMRSTLTEKLVDNYIMNLFGEKTAYVTHENNHLELYLKRYEAID